ncbi:iron complex outermembrane receptor protein [Mesocricetibacter intestinalis]|uniref:Iron complex outermembrane receptor protein n=1 Tax=Mesocricetibacter intestinalis TaxID=1521930 RepID=A0A4R6V7R7_9PAST|nr:TonB-dependent siderophore receptor [Mesocricetibacter intestinalis]TDQ57151.1 iron complex outermembrane receptor protein [Mesocricetibacter intestinalis]
MKKNFIYSAIAGAVLFALNSAAAQQQSGQLEEIEVVGSMNKLEIQPFNQAKSALVINEGEMRLEGADKADEIGRYQAGFTNQVFGSDTNTNWFRLRGTEASQAIDGMPALNQGFFTPQIETFGLEAVEVIKGADSMAFGAANSGGLINYISKRPHKESVGKGEISTHFGNKNQRGTGIDYTGALNEDNSLRYRLVGAYRHAGGEWAGTYSESYYFAPSIAWDISDKTNLTILASYLKNVGTPSSNFVPQSGSLVATPAGKISPHSNLGDPTQDNEKNLVRTIGYEFTHDFGNGISFRQNYRYQHMGSHHQSAYVWPSLYDSAYNPLPFTDSYDITRSLTYNDGTARSHSLDNRISWKYNNDWLENTLVAGFDYRHQKFDAFYYQFGTTSKVNILNPAASYGSPQDVSKAPRILIKSRQQGYYLQNAATLWNTLGLSLGLRHDKVHNSESTYTQEVKKDHTSYSAAVMYYNDLGLNPYYAYTEAFTMPNGLSGNQTLYDPNITKQHEVGVKYMPSWVEGTISLAFFKAKDKGALIGQGLGNTISSADPIKRKGAELQANLNLSEKLNAVIAYTYLQAQTQGAGGNVMRPLIPKHSASGRISYQFNQKLTAGAGVRYIGNSVSDAGSLYAGKKISSATLVDLFARYNLSENLVSQLNINNLANRKYLAGCDYYCYYAEGISAVASISYKF